jgi:hypothetical protein
VLTGADALNSPQYKAVQAFLEPCRQKDVEAIRATIDPKTADAMMQMFSGGQGRSAELGCANGSRDPGLHPHENHRARRIGRGRVQGPKPDSGSSQTLRVVQANGEWKLAR